ncbi:DUF1194 domain-containing protein [Aminobacter sp. AP02]|uniref:DUF1194 domain-containing protein n=1 Tax=Aminobacter sp. AP02 TaxID=2135737 RepID=UPI000D6BE721|nr:DUF1194 domain-containing protein [Aminobacter sp. AP02]PWK68437.1 uncharacterized protein DUF1194 [Aminobacter sp. AP02]
MLATLALILCMNCELPVTPIVGADAGTVDVELVLAVDVSSSMDDGEFALQRAGYVGALRDPAFINAVLSGLRGRIAVTYFEWAGSVLQDTVIPWQVIDGRESADDFAAKLAASPIGGSGGTSISNALVFGAGLLENNALRGEKKVIDISGDGPNNTGAPVEVARNNAVATGIIINGLPILVRPTGSLEGVDRYYAECVTGGPGSFVLPIYRTSEFITAIRRKLILEVSGVNAPNVVKIQATEPVDCLVGEHYRLIYPEP